MKLVLTILEGPGEKEQFVFDSHDTFIVGRSKKNTHSRLRGDPYISRHHFILELDPPSCYLKDLGSTNGTVVNGARLERGELRELFRGDEIRVGKTMLKLELDEDEDEDEDEEGREDTIFLDRDQPQTEVISLPETAHQHCLCEKCGRDMNDPAGIDSPPSEMYEGAHFLCHACAEQEPAMMQHYGEYQVLSLLGKGGMGEVWKCRHRKNGLLVALKTLPAQVSPKNDAIQRFKREMKVMRELIHPNIIRFLEQGHGEREHYIVMELVKGGSASDLMEKVQRRPLGIREGCNIVCQALEGLHFAHQRGFIHRDIKPHNILLQRSGNAWIAKISDFGLAKSFRDAGGSMMTREGEAAGTIIFMAPEQLTDYRFVKPPADIYSMGVSLYYILSGKYPFPYPSPLDEIRAKEEGKSLRRDDYPDPLMLLLSEEPELIERKAPGITAPLASVVNKAVAKEESERFSSAGEMREALLDVLTKCG